MLGAAPKESPVLRLPLPRKWASSLTMAVASQSSRPPELVPHAVLVLRRHATRYATTSNMPGKFC